MKRMIIELPERLYQEIIDGGVEKVSPELYWALYNCDPVPEGHMKWIPTSDRLPDDAGFYVVTKKQKSGEIQVSCANYNPDFGWSGNGNFKNVIAWMKLPGPYKEEKTDGVER